MGVVKNMIIGIIQARFKNTDFHFVDCMDVA